MSTWIAPAASVVIGISFTIRVMANEDGSCRMCEVQISELGRGRG